MLGLQCPKALYLKVHHPNLETPASPSQQMLFDQGHEVGAMAHTRYPGGVLIDSKDQGVALEHTKDAISTGTNTIYEATLASDDVLVKVDILHRESPGDKWQLIEVKSATSVKDVYLQDVAIQANTVEDCGLILESATVMHINNQCIWPNQSDLFSLVDVSDKISKLREEMPSQIARLKAVVDKPMPPDVPLGPHCSSPYNCSFREHCWQEVPSPSIFEIPGFKNKVWNHYDSGIIQPNDSRLPAFRGSRIHQIEAMVSGTPWIDRKEISHQLKRWQWPLYYLDFETINHAIPRFDGVRPFEQIPFQFSCHVQESLSSSPVHHEFLHDELSDPRLPLSKELLPDGA